ncbi:MAG: hypothetical protein HQK51_20905 [Oligoflexia bacterium]|nr:hypothetical protein [Oligoflexia bacterium]
MDRLLFREIFSENAIHATKLFQGIISSKVKKYAKDYSCYLCPCEEVLPMIIDWTASTGVSATVFWPSFL